MIGLDELAAEADIVIVHLPLTDETHHLVDAAFLAGLKPGAFLINVSRGPVGRQRCADCRPRCRPSSRVPDLDVVEGEPDPPAALVARADVIATPHVAFSSDASLAELRRRGAEEVVRVLAGEPPENPCNSIG